MGDFTEIAGFWVWWKVITASASGEEHLRVPSPGCRGAGSTPGCPGPHCPSLILPGICPGAGAHQVWAATHPQPMVYQEFHVLASFNEFLTTFQNLQAGQMPSEHLFTSTGRTFGIQKSCLALCDPMDYSPPGSSVHGILQARIPERFAISSSRGSSWPRDGTCISCIGRQILYHWATWEAPKVI